MHIHPLDFHGLSQFQFRNLCLISHSFLPPSEMQFPWPPLEAHTSAAQMLPGHLSLSTHRKPLNSSLKGVIPPSRGASCFLNVPEDRLSNTPGTAEILIVCAVCKAPGLTALSAVDGDFSGLLQVHYQTLSLKSLTRKPALSCFGVTVSWLVFFSLSTWS